MNEHSNLNLHVTSFQFLEKSPSCLSTDSSIFILSNTSLYESSYGSTNIKRFLSNKPLQGLFANLLKIHVTQMLACIKGQLSEGVLLVLTLFWSLPASLNSSTHKHWFLNTQTQKFGILQVGADVDIYSQNGKLST